MQMDRWKQSLDRWLTTPPEDAFEGYYESVVEYIEASDQWIESEVCQRWIDIMYEEDKEPEDAGIIINRAKKLYKL